MKATVRIAVTLEVEIEETWDEKVSLHQVLHDGARTARARVTNLLTQGPGDVGQNARGVRLVDFGRSVVTVADPVPR